MLCESPWTIAHHLLRAEPRGMGLKAGDNWTVPLCGECHDKLHLNGDEVDFFEFYGWDYPAVKEYARVLWANKGEKDA